MTYKEIEALSPEAYLNPENFTTAMDYAPGREYAAKQYAKGLEIGRASLSVHISCNGVWGATGKDGSSVSSYEGIGYHSATKDLLRGFLDSGCAIDVYRYGVKGATRIK